MRRRALALALSLAGLIVGGLAAPDVSLARTRHHHYVHRTAYYQRAPARDAACVRHKANNGTVIGAVAGGVLGNVVGGHGVGGTLIGAGAGAVAGHQIAKHGAHC